MSVCPIATVLLNRGKNRDIYARAFLHLALMSVLPPTFWFLFYLIQTLYSLYKWSMLTSSYCFQA